MSRAASSKTAMNSANDFPLLFRVDHVPQFAEESFPRIDRLHRNVKSVGENCLDLMTLAAAKQAVVHENALEPLADCAMNQQRRHRAVHSSRQGANHRALGRLTSDRFFRSRDEILHRPAATGLAVGKQEGFEHFPPLRVVDNLGVELQTVNWLKIVSSGRVR